MASKKAQQKAQPKPGPAQKNQKAVPTKARASSASARKASAPANVGSTPDKNVKASKNATSAPEKKRSASEGSMGTPEKAVRPKSAKKTPAAASKPAPKANTTKAPVKKAAPAKRPSAGEKKASKPQGKVSAISSTKMSAPEKQPSARAKSAPAEKSKAITVPKGKAQPANVNAKLAPRVKRAPDVDPDDALLAFDDEPKRAPPTKKSKAKPAENVVALPLPGSKAKERRKGKTAPEDAAPSALDKVQSAPVASDRTGIDVGDHAPSFVLKDDSGTVVSSETLRGSPYVLYFYPKDDTPGCTLQACGFRDSLPRFSAKGVRVLGVSPDLPEIHARFKKKYELSFPLLSDPEKTLAKAYGVWVKKQNYGREYMGVERSTFFVDRNGNVSKVWRGVKVPGHVDLVLDAV